MKSQEKKYFFTPAKIKKVVNKTYIDLTKPGAYLPAEMYHPENGLYDELYRDDFQ